MLLGFLLFSSLCQEVPSVASPLRSDSPAPLSAPALRLSTGPSGKTISFLGQIEQELQTLYQYLRPSSVLVRFSVAVQQESRSELKNIFVSGLVLDASGLVVAPVIPTSARAGITLRDWKGKEASAVVIAESKELGVSLLKVEGLNLESPPFGFSEDLPVGSFCLAIGNGFGLESSFSLGIVSGKQRNFQGKTQLLQVSNPVNPGDGGSLLANQSGQIVGILLISLRGEEATDSRQISTSFPPASGISFALPIQHVLRAFQEFQPHAPRPRPRLGLGVELQLRGGKARLVVVRVLPDFPAEVAGIRLGDILLRFEGQPLQRPEDLLRLLAKAPVSVSVSFLREGKLRTVQVDLLLPKRKE